MLDTYRAVFRAPGSAAFCAAAFVMRLPIAIYPLGLVLIASSRNGHYAFGGVLAGVYVVANGIGNPVLARVADRHGQRRLLIVASLVHALAAGLLAACVLADWPDWTLVAPTALTGFCYLAISSLVRARWSHVLGPGQRLATAFSLESTLDELIFVLGPVIATVVATRSRPVLVLYLAAGLVLIGAVWLSGLRGSEPPPRPADEARPPSALRERGMPLLALVALAMGAVFASAEVTMVAFCGQHGHRGLSGLMLGAFAFGSASSGFYYGSRHRAGALLDRFRVQAVIFGLLPVLFLAATGVSVLPVIAFVVGLGIAPTLITLYGLIEQIVPAGSLTEGLSWLVTGISLGYGAGSSVVGGIADAHGARSAFLVTVGAGLLVVVLGLALHAQLTGRPEPVPVET